MFGALLGPALSFGSSLISGLGARQSAKKQAKVQAAYEYQNYLLKIEENRRNRDEIITRNAVSKSVGLDVSGYGSVLVDLANEYKARAFSGATGTRNFAKEAEEQGFNPVTWLNATAGWQDQTQLGYAQLAADTMLQGLNMKVQGSQMAIPEAYMEETYMMNAPTAQVPSATEAVGGALQAGVNTYLTDMRAVDSRNFQREMLATQIAAINSRNGTPSSGIGVPVGQRTFFGSGQIPYAQSVGRQARAGVAPGTWDPSNEKTDYVNPLGGLTTPGGTVIGTPTGYNRFPGAQAMQGIFGDEGPLPVIYGGFNTANYAWWSLTGRDIDTSLWIAGREAARNRMLQSGGYDVYNDGARGVYPRYSTGGGF